MRAICSETYRTTDRIDTLRVSDVCVWPPMWPISDTLLKIADQLVQICPGPETNDRDGRAVHSGTRDRSRLGRRRDRGG